MKKFLLSASALLASLTMHALSFVYDNVSYTVIDETTCSVDGVVSDDITVVNIPETVYYTTGPASAARSWDPGTTYALTVVAVSYEGFSNNTKITEVSLPKTITSFGVSAFNNCTALTTVNIPPKVSNLSNYSFCGCTSLNSITIPSSLRSADLAFMDCGTINEVTIADSNKSLSISFSGTKIKSLYQGRDIPSSFDNKGIETLVIGDSVTAINGWMFEE
ncbi:leucine-rich repeat domain-containing protein, partial [uncultured Muribaculum sp.]